MANKELTSSEFGTLGWMTETKRGSTRLSLGADIYPNNRSMSMCIANHAMKILSVGLSIFEFHGTFLNLFGHRNVFGQTETTV